MSEKYIDLIHAIESSDSMTGCERVTVEAVLAWLDARPDQVPGRTITRHDFERAFDFHFDDEDIDRHERFLAHLSVTVVPDPEPTFPLPTEPGVQFIAHSPKLSDDPEDQREFVIAGQYIVALDSAAVYSRELFEDAGWTVTSLVTAPGGDDDQ